LVLCLLTNLTGCAQLVSPKSELVANFTRLDLIVVRGSGQPVPHAIVDLVVRTAGVPSALVDSVRGATDDAGLFRYDRAMPIDGWYPFAADIVPNVSVGLASMRIADSLRWERSASRRTIVVALPSQ
jgi:hypothetical protein